MIRSLPDRERDRDVGRLGGIAQGACRAPRPEIARPGMSAGLLAGALFLLFQMVAAAVTGAWSVPLRAAASLVAGSDALAPTYPLSAALVMGLMAAGAVSAFWGALFASLAAWTRPPAGVWLAAGGVAFGLAVWAIDLRLASLAWPWLLKANSTVQLAGHALFYGLPLGLALGEIWRLRE